MLWKFLRRRLRPVEAAGGGSSAKASSGPRDPFHLVLVTAAGQSSALSPSLLALGGDFLSTQPALKSLSVVALGGANFDSEELEAFEEISERLGGLFLHVIEPSLTPTAASACLLPFLTDLFLNEERKAYFAKKKVTAAGWGMLRGGARDSYAVRK